MRQRLFVLLLLLTGAMMMGVMIILSVTGTFSIGLRESEAVMSNELSHMKGDLDLKYSIWTAECVQMSQTLSNEIETKLGAMGVSASDLSAHPEVLSDLLGSEYQTCAFYLQRSDCSGVFVILNATVNPLAENAAYSRSGIYLTDSDPDSVSLKATSYFLLRGFPNIGMENQVSLHPEWALEFNVENAPYYNAVMQNASGSISLNKQYYWSEPMYLPGVSEQVMLCSVPLIASDGTVIGVCGCEISKQTFKDIFSPNDSAFARIFMMFRTQQASVTITLDDAFVCGGYTPSENQILAIGKKKNALIEFNQDDGTVYYGYQDTVNLYSEGSPYEDELWQVSVLLPKEDVSAASVHLIRTMVILFALLLVALVFLALLISKRYIAPIVSGLDAIKTNEFGEQKTKVREVDELLSYLAEHKQEISEKDAMMQSGMIEDFLEKTETLTPAERAVFQLYVQDYTAQEIADEMILSINTIKTHTKRIYQKLGVGSRDEMMVYVNMLREIGKEIG